MTHPVPEINWENWRACPVCKTPLGSPCFSRSGMVVDGRPDGVNTFLPRPHNARSMRKPRKTAFSSAPLAH